MCQCIHESALDERELVGVDSHQVDVERGNTIPILVEDDGEFPDERQLDPKRCQPAQGDHELRITIDRVQPTLPPKVKCNDGRHVVKGFDNRWKSGLDGELAQDRQRKAMQCGDRRAVEGVNGSGAPG